MEFIIENFQSIKSLTLNLNEGVTTLRGPTNSGKTAAIRAVCAMVNNSARKQHVRRGSKALKITCRWGENREVVYTRGTTATASYIVDGKKYEKLNRDGLESVCPDFPLLPINVGKRSLLLNVHGQHDPLLITSWNSADRYKIFLELFQDAEIVDLEKNQREREKEFRDRRKSLKGSLDEALITKTGLTKTMECYPEELPALLPELEETSSRREKTGAILEEIDRANRHVKVMQPVMRSASNLAATIDDCSEELSHVQDKKTSVRNYLDVKKRVDSIKLPDLTRLEESVNKFGSFQEKASRIRENVESVSRINSDVKRLISQMYKVQETIDSVGHKERHLSAYETEKDALRKYMSAENENIELDGQVEKTANELKEIVAENPQCPTCGAPLSEDLCSP